MANRLNIPKQSNVSKFDEVDFVNDMSVFQLKTLIKNMWENMGELANIMDETGREDVSDVIDKMRDGSTWSISNLRGRFRYALNSESVIVYDGKQDVFRLLDNEGNNFEYKAVDAKNVMKNIKQIAKGK